MLTEELAQGALSVATNYVAGKCQDRDFQVAVRQAQEIAGSHPGSGSIDASGHAAVVATNALDRALNGEAREAANYAAYAAVYAYGGYAVSDPGAYADEHR